MRIALTSLLFFLLWACACADDDAGPIDSGPSVVDAPGTDTGPSPSGPTIEIGLGRTEFIEISDEDEAELVMGPQGGWHIDVAFRLYEIDPMDLILRINGYDDITDMEKTLPIERVLTSRRVTPEGDHFLRFGDQMIFAVDDGSEAVGLLIRIEAEMEPEGGAPVRAEAVVRIIDDE